MAILPAAALRRATHEALQLRWAEVEDVCEVGCELGAGGFGIVRQARLSATGAKCAIKAVPKSNHEKAHWARAEARVLRRLQHKHVCGFLDAFEDADHVYQAMELLEGRDLFEELSARERLSEDQAAAIMQQVFQALEHCHDRGIVHRDLKPENIMLHGSLEEPDSVRAKLIDFGLALDLQDEREHSTDVVGSSHFMAPEGHIGRFSRASDLWSAGATLFTLLTGELPPACVEEALAKLSGSNSKLASDLVGSLMAVHPADRISAAKACRHPWIESLGAAVADEACTTSLSEEAYALSQPCSVFWMMPLSSLFFNEF